MLKINLFDEVSNGFDIYYLWYVVFMIQEQGGSDSNGSIYIIL